MAVEKPMEMFSEIQASQKIGLKLCLGLSFALFAFLIRN